MQAAIAKLLETISNFVVIGDKWRAKLIHGFEPDPELEELVEKLHRLFFKADMSSHSTDGSVRAEKVLEAAELIGIHKARIRSYLEPYSSTAATHAHGAELQRLRIAHMLKEILPEQTN